MICCHTARPTLDAEIDQMRTFAQKILALSLKQLFMGFQNWVLSTLLVAVAKSCACLKNDQKKSARFVLDVKQQHQEQMFWGWCARFRRDSFVSLVQLFKGFQNWVLSTLLVGVVKSCACLKNAQKSARFVLGVGHNFCNFQVLYFRAYFIGVQHISIVRVGAGSKEQGTRQGPCTLVRWPVGLAGLDWQS